MFCCTLVVLAEAVLAWNPLPTLERWAAQGTLSLSECRAVLHMRFRRCPSGFRVFAELVYPRVATVSVDILRASTLVFTAIFVVPHKSSGLTDTRESGRELR